MEVERKSKIIDAFQRFHQSQRKPFVPKIEGISQNDFFLLHHLMTCLKQKEELLGKKDERLGIQISVLSLAANMSKPAVSQALNSLEDRGLIERFSCKGDRRAVYVTMTDKGTAIMAQGWKTFISLMDCVEKKMGEENTEKLVELVEQFINIMDEVRSEFEAETENGGSSQI